MFYQVVTLLIATATALPNTNSNAVLRQRRQETISDPSTGGITGGRMTGGGASGGSGGSRRGGIRGPQVRITYSPNSPTSRPSRTIKKVIKRRSTTKGEAKECGYPTTIEGDSFWCKGTRIEGSSTPCEGKVCLCNTNTCKAGERIELKG